MKLAVEFRDHRHYRACDWVHIFEVPRRLLFKFFLLYALTFELKNRRLNISFFRMQTEQYVILKMEVKYNN